jgi:tryptophanyl-tRNA synthetase
LARLWRSIPYQLTAEDENHKRKTSYPGLTIRQGEDHPQLRVPGGQDQQPYMRQWRGVTRKVKSRKKEKCFFPPAQE